MWGVWLFTFAGLLAAPDWLLSNFATHEDVAAKEGAIPLVEFSGEYRHGPGGWMVTLVSTMLVKTAAGGHASLMAVAQRLSDFVVTSRAFVRWNGQSI